MNKLILIAACVAAATASNKIGPVLTTTLENGHTANIMITFVGRTTQILNSIETRSFASRTQRLTTLASALERHTESSQKNVAEFLKSKSVEFKSFWINNKIFIKGADKHLIKSLAAFPEIEEITQERIITLDNPVSKKAPKQVNSRLADNEWGIEKISAPQAWAITNGSGVVVSSIDTGVRVTHEALKDSYKGDSHSWFDPYTGSATPNDAQGHGTHTMGTIAGSKGIGVAPGSKWISCKGCSGSGCTEEALNGCGQWALCPTKADGSDRDCSKAPVLVSNSWGGGRGDKFYEDITEAWIAGGIVPIFSQGNSGPSCATANSPGDLRRVIGVGATDIDDAIAYFSSVGPAADGRIKPEVSAPGENVRSSVPDSDTAYGSKSGTSMACPHVAGVTALLLSVKPNQTFAEVRRALLAGVDTELSSDNQSCGSIADTQFPNHIFGWGRVNALKLVQAAKASLHQ